MTRKENFDINGCGGSSLAPIQFTPGADASIWEVRTEEQSYAFLPEQPIAERNRYGQLIDLIDLTEHKLPVGRSLPVSYTHLTLPTKRIV